MSVTAATHISNTTIMVPGETCQIQERGRIMLLKPEMTPSVGKTILILSMRVVECKAQRRPPRRSGQPLATEVCRIIRCSSSSSTCNSCSSSSSACNSCSSSSSNNNNNSSSSLLRFTTIEAAVIAAKETTTIKKKAEHNPRAAWGDAQRTGRYGTQYTIVY